MAYTPLSTDFKDQILSDVNTQRKYKQTVNEDGTMSLLDMTAYDQQGSSYSAKDINEERKAINEKLKAQIKDICPILIKGSIEEARKAKEA